MHLTLGNFANIVSQYEHELDACAESRSTNANPFLQSLILQKIQHDLPRLLRAVNDHKTTTAGQLLFTRLHELSDSVDEQLYEQKKADALFLDRYKTNTTVDPAADTIGPMPTDTPQPTDDDNYASLRKRLLADGAATSLDNDANASNEQMNNYHETFQEDLLSDLTGLASTLKNSALSLSAKIADDAHLVSETGESMMRSLTLMLSVGTNLNAYFSEKTGGKITVFFMIKTMAFVFVLFFLMVVIAKILPKM
ncbi:hypothetical protein METBIDRAFT_35751 [Metschnikowia bicuspidata var. bicuspidata NRRL YB-4993]|uniref:Uncharacterized protein n=1 Tax=Metschnikowia bicuspidata var. bicuspidata NRRL YB-4993 TaxID=869754 RepID=A0A1A0HK10_9ASCO|nr:hypothetical protein METBIDRAFT_35751 [Metschnikowia bicuspidata var. bicuspidata NRRL YB-4993]OBA24222.1 hypothetical protein METBIDRAFT_35751 [Metschnikowia bicuspidata var. bicuspidata NRRL YB-4993]